MKITNTLLSLNPFECLIGKTIVAVSGQTIDRYSDGKDLVERFIVTCSDGTTESFVAEGERGPQGTYIREFDESDCQLHESEENTDSDD